MGRLLDALTRPTAYRAKQTDIWDQIMGRIDAAMTYRDLEDVEGWLLGQTLNIPSPWEEHIVEALEKRREEIKAEDIGLVLRDRYDFK